MTKRPNKLRAVRQQINDLNQQIKNIFKTTKLNNNNLLDVQKIIRDDEAEHVICDNICTTYRNTYFVHKFHKHWVIVVEENNYEQFGMINIIDKDVYVIVNGFRHYDFYKTKSLYRDKYFDEDDNTEVASQWSLGYPKAKYVLSKVL